MVEIEFDGKKYTVKKPFPGDKRYKDVITFTPKQIDELLDKLLELRKEKEHV